MVQDPYQYDIAVSFAGAQRAYVEQFVEACRELDLVVVYDRDMEIKYWGRNLIYEFRNIYGGTAAQFVVPFITVDYLNGSYPLDEFAAAVGQGFHRRGEYLLPVIMGRVSIPQELLNPAIGHLCADDLTPAQLARKTQQRVRLAEVDSTSPDPKFGIEMTSPTPRAAVWLSRSDTEAPDAADAVSSAAAAGPGSLETTGFLRTSPSPARPVTYAGSGNKVLTIEKPESGPVLVTTTNVGPEQNFTVYALDANLAEGDLLVNAIGSYTGAAILDRDGKFDTRRLKISGGGSWQIVLEPLTAARPMTTSIAGTGDDVIWYRGPLGVATVSNRGPDVNFTVYFYDKNGEELIANEIGSYDGETTIRDGPAFITVNGGGSWSIEVTPQNS